MSEQEPTAAPKDENLRFISFHHNLYPKIMLPEIDMNNYRINRIMDQYKYLDEERKTRNILRKKYTNLSNACLGTEFLITVSELGTVVTSIALPVIIPVSVIISVALTSFSTVLRSTSGLITKKINKHSEIELICARRVYCLILQHRPHHRLSVPTTSASDAT